MRYLKKFEKYNASLDLNYILEDDVYSDSDAIKLLKKVKYAIDNDCVIDNINIHWMERTPLITCAVLDCHIKTQSKYRNIFEQIAKELINSGANINHIDKDNRSALIWATDRGHFDVMELLIENGADWNIMDVFHHEFHEYLSDEHFEKIIHKYPEQYELYNMKNNTNKFNL